jgi:hypothetical protein
LGRGISFAKGRGSGYLFHMLKRIADWLEKISAGSMLIGLYQGNNYAILFGFLLVFVSLVLEWRMKK